MKYKIVAERDSTRTEEKVQELLDSGWMLHGCMTVTNYQYIGGHGQMEHELAFCQAMTKSDPVTMSVEQKEILADTIFNAEKELYYDKEKE